jgi:hypothetical protein
MVACATNALLAMPVNFLAASFFVNFHDNLIRFPDDIIGFILEITDFDDNLILLPHICAIDKMDEISQGIILIFLGVE